MQCGVVGEAPEERNDVVEERQEGEEDGDTICGGVSAVDRVECDRHPVEA